jgi:hypothetical protein
MVMAFGAGSSAIEMSGGSIVGSSTDTIFGCGGGGASVSGAGKSMMLASIGVCWNTWRMGAQ